MHTIRHAPRGSIEAAIRDSDWLLRFCANWALLGGWLAITEPLLEPLPRSVSTRLGSQCIGAVWCLNLSTLISARAGRYRCRVGRKQRRAVNTVTGPKRCAHRQPCRDWPPTGVASCCEPSRADACKVTLLWCLCRVASRSDRIVLDAHSGSVWSTE